MSDPGVQILLRALDTGYDHKSWHGAILRGSLRGISPEEAAWRPSPKRHNIWELAIHAAYWKYSVLHRLRREVRFPLKGSNWFPRPDGEISEPAWKADLRILEQIHRDLRAAVAALQDKDLETIPEGSKTKVRDLVLGAAYHDIYHAGQIQLLKRLREGR
ncbi:MAG TPA: DinB family protein [Thermoanaerobaculia bacterium]